MRAKSSSRNETHKHLISHSCLSARHLRCGRGRLENFRARRRVTYDSAFYLGGTQWGCIVRRSDEIIFIGLSITSSWRNVHASTYRSLIHGLHLRGQKVLFLEHDRSWYASNRDAPILPSCQSRLYMDLEELRARFTPRIRAAAAVIVGSGIDDGRRVCDWVLDHAKGVRAFYDIDAPATLSKLRNDHCEYLRASQVPEFDLILSTTGGPALQCYESEFGAGAARALYCSVDTDRSLPLGMRRDVELGHLRAYSEDLQPALEQYLNEPARRLPKRRFAVVGAQYPSSLVWPKNVALIGHMAPGSQAQFYGRQRFALNLTPAQLRNVGYSPTLQLLEAAACGTPIIADDWPGRDDLFESNDEILLAGSADDVTNHLCNVSDEQAQRVAAAARERVCAEHSSVYRAKELENYLAEGRCVSERRAEMSAVSGGLPPREPLAFRPTEFSAERG